MIQFWWDTSLKELLVYFIMSKNCCIEHFSVSRSLTNAATFTWNCTCSNFRGRHAAVVLYCSRCSLLSWNIQKYFSSLFIIFQQRDIYVAGKENICVLQYDVSSFIVIIIMTVHVKWCQVEHKIYPSAWGHPHFQLSDQNS